MNEMKKITILSALLFSLVSLSSCEKWLDVSPKTEVKVKENFENETGFKDALTGVYLLMTSESLYGRDLSYGMVDVLAKQYTEISSSYHDYYYMARYGYTDDTCIDRFDAIWSSAYNTIANLNILIENVDKASPSLFTANNQSIIKGEAYALRAFLHFDLLRLFGPSFVTGASKISIPYVKESGKELTEFSSVSQVIDNLLSDLEVAENALSVDPINEQRTATEDDATYVKNRGLKFNYYAVKLLQARVNLYKEDYNAAFLAAQVVINQGQFTWTPSSEITTTTVADRNRIFSQELVFALNVTSMKSLYTTWFTSTNGFMMSQYYWDQLFETSLTGYSGDYRYQYLTDNSTGTRYSIKLQQPETTTSDYARRMPVMRFTEAFYIAAECKLKTVGVAAAISYLNTVRSKRNIMAVLPETLSASEVQNEIFKEYAKEFMCEGQLFYYYKRLNLSSIRFNYSGVSVDNIYVLPLPLDELGNR